MLSGPFTVWVASWVWLWGPKSPQRGNNGEDLNKLESKEWGGRKGEARWHDLRAFPRGLLALEDRVIENPLMVQNLIYLLLLA